MPKAYLNMYMKYALGVQVLNMKPPEILSMLEEAAGTRMYENKKEAALKTLEKKQIKVEEINKVSLAQPHISCHAAVYTAVHLCCSDELVSSPSATSPVSHVSMLCLHICDTNAASLPFSLIRDDKGQLLGA